MDEVFKRRESLSRTPPQANSKIERTNKYTEEAQQTNRRKKCLYRRNKRQKQLSPNWEIIRSSAENPRSQIYENKKLITSASTSQQNTDVRDKLRIWKFDKPMKELEKYISKLHLLTDNPCRPNKEIEDAPDNVTLHVEMWIMEK